MIALMTGLGGISFGADNPLPNPGFEEGPSQWWSIGDNSSQIMAEAAHSGKLGLRIGTTNYNPRGASVTSAKVAVNAGQEFTLAFWARGTPNCSGVYIQFYNAAGKGIKDSDPKTRGSGGQSVCLINQQSGEWHPYTMKVTALPGAVSVALWIHSFSGAAGLVDLDDFSFTGLAAHATATPPAPPRRIATPAAPDKPLDFSARKTPPIIIIKLDDVKQVRGNVSAPWIKVADFLKSRHIKGGFGILCDTLPEATPQYIKWIKDLHDSGLIEFWFHGWDHGTHAVNGEELKEFNQRTYEEQKDRFDKSQKLALEKLGFSFATFGPPGGGTGPGTDANTDRVMQDDPYMRAWLYPEPINEAGKALESKGKIVILDRVWQVNFESAVGVPDYQAFVTGYAANPQREYFVLQGHPAQWAGTRFDEFMRIIDFLVSQKAVFMTPAEFAATQKK